jgi:hypothetical protein
MPKPRYKPIDKAKNQIRLLRILPLRDHPRAFGVESMPQGRNVVVCTIEVVSLDDSLEYAALSYVWGDYIPRMVVFVDGRPVETSFSLEGALQALQHETKPVFVWADALCINQADNLERHHQVQLMARIYKTATSVFVWLGCPLSRLEETMEITSDKAMDFLDDLGLKALEFGILNLDISDVNNILSSDVREDLHGIRDSLEALVEQKMFNIPWHDLNFFFCYPWFSRIWVIQEAAVTRNRPVVFTCGEKKLPLRHLQASLAFIDYFRMRFAMNFPWEDFTDPEKSLYWTAMNECNTWRPTRLLRARRIYQEEGSRKRRNLYELLIDMHVDYAARDQLQASDPHDRIFALLGMATSALGLKADYNASCVEAYTLAAAAMLKEGHLDLLALNQSPEARTISHEDSELPTWAPNWSSRIYRPCGGYMKDECYQASGQEKSFVDFRSLPKGGNTWTSQLRRCKSQCL